MIIMDLKADNIYSFNDFHINFAYPKKLINSTIPNEFLPERQNFRYKKVNIIMGTNASGKTTFGYLLLMIFNFMKQSYAIMDFAQYIYDSSKPAMISMDFVLDDLFLYRIDIESRNDASNSKSKHRVCVRKVAINVADDYEKCAEKLDGLPLEFNDSIYEELEKIDTNMLGWDFSFPVSDDLGNTSYMNDSKIYPDVLERILKTLDLSVKKVEKLPNVNNSYIIWLKDKKLLMQEGRLAIDNILSSGTVAGIEIAAMIARIIDNKKSRVYYCDEKFSFLNSDIEQAIISLMIEKLGDRCQLFVTSHNSDILGMNLPKHSFTFFRKDSDGKIDVVYASDYLKKNTDSLKNAVDNDLFSTVPRLELINEIATSFGR